jgi:hypothetical protein
MAASASPVPQNIAVAPVTIDEAVKNRSERDLQGGL